jgi:hypothetical protein
MAGEQQPRSEGAAGLHRLALREQIIEPPPQSRAGVIPAARRAGPNSIPEVWICISHKPGNSVCPLAFTIDREVLIGRREGAASIVLPHCGRCGLHMDSSGTALHLQAQRRVVAGHP